MDLLSKKEKIRILLHYFVGYTLVYQALFGIVVGIIFAVFIKGDYEESSNAVLLIAMFLVELFVLWRILYLAKPMLVADFEIFKTKLNHIMFDSCKVYLMMLGVTLIINLIISLVNPSESMNQQQLEGIFEINPLFLSFTAVIFAPLVEEIVFRGVIFNLLTRKLGLNTSAIISGVLFGLLHVIVSVISGDFLDTLHLFSYAAMGYFLGRHYYKTQNIWASITVHFINNFVAIILMFVAG